MATIINPTQREVNGKTIFEIEYQLDRWFWCCGYLVGSNQILLMTTEDPETEHDGRIQSVSSLLDGFGLIGTYEEFMQEIENRGLILPPSE